MTLRLRLVAGLVVLMTAGLAVFGGTMYGLYSRSQYDALGQQLKNSVPLVTQELAHQGNMDLGGSPGSQTPPGGAVNGGPPPARGGGQGAGDNGGGGTGGPGGLDVLVAPGTFGELLNAKGKVLTSIQQERRVATPRLPGTLLEEDRGLQDVRLSSVSGTTTWLADLSEPYSNGDRVIVAVPTSDVVSSLHRLVFIEVTGAAALLVILSLGAGLVLRRGLSPLERFAGTAEKIAAGDINQRVQVAHQATEVGQLGVAFNTMLDEIQAAFAQRDATEERLRRFLADASHELRTPLTSIQGFAELSRLGTESPHVDTPTIMRRIEEEAARMKGLVEDLLLLARLDQVREGEKVPVDLAVLAADACSDAVAAGPGRPVTLSAPVPVVVLGDEAHLRQALGNLVANAVRHTPPGTPIEVSARLDQGQALLEVRDHGPGLDEETMAHAFDRFWQADPARSAKGAGLGLAIVAAVAAEHEGAATAANAEGGGALFCLRLPLVSGPATSLSQPSGSSLAGR